MIEPHKLYIVFGVSPFAFCDNLEDARRFVNQYPEKKMEIREILLNTEFRGFITVPGEPSDNDWMDLWSCYGG